MFAKVTLLACVAAAAAVPAPEAEPIHVPLTRPRLEPRADGSFDLAGMLSELNNTLAKYKSKHRLLPRSHYGADILDGILEERAGSVPLKDQATDVLYYGNIQTGTTNKQTFTIDFDTGSSDLFVPGPNCPSCHGTPYNEKGASEGNTTSVTYGSGQVSGKNFFDTVCAGGLCASHTNLISLTQSAGFATAKSDGLMGMGFSTIANSKQHTFFENLIAQKKVTTHEFSFYLGRKKSGTGPKSLLTLGGRNGSRFKGKPQSHKVSKKGYWQLAIDGLAVNGGASILGAGQSAIDTGTTLILAPTIATVGFAAAFGAVPVPIALTGSPTMTAFAYQCNSKKTVDLVFDGKRYTISAADLNLGTITGGGSGPFGNLGGLCALSIIAADLMPGQEFYVVGDSFLKNWYSIYNYNKGGSVSFAKAV